MTVIAFQPNSNKRLSPLLPFIGKCIINSQIAFLKWKFILYASLWTSSPKGKKNRFIDASPKDTRKRVFFMSACLYFGNYLGMSLEEPLWPHCWPHLPPGNTSIPSGITCHPSLSSHLHPCPNCPLLSPTSSHFLMLRESHTQSAGLTRGSPDMRLARHGNSETHSWLPHSLIKPRSFYFLEAHPTSWSQRFKWIRCI